MKTSVLYSAVIAAATLTLSSCGGGVQNDPLAAIITGAAGGAAQNQTTGAAQGILGDLIGGLLGNLTPVSASSLKGSWTYVSPECRFESENVLAKAGGAVVANKVEQQLGSYLAKVGFKEGSTTFVFDGKSNCTISTGDRTIIAGTYTVNSQTRAINIKGTTGLISLNGTVYQSGNTVTLLFESNKLLGFIKGASSLLGNNASAAVQLFDYDGMQLGMNLKR